MARALKPVQSLPVSVKNPASGSLRRCTSSPPPRHVCGLRLAVHSDSRAFAPHSPTQSKPSTSRPDGWHGPIRPRQVAGYRQPVRQNLHRPLLRPHPGVAEYMQRTKEQAAVQSFVETLSGRRLYLPNIRNKNANARAGAERAAISAPIQGTASNLIKRAMTDVSAGFQTA